MEDAAGSPTTAWSRSLNHCTANPQGVAELRARASGNHQWTSSSHHRPTFCNFCREKLSGVPWHGMACEVCKIKTHKRCALQLTDPCKWSVLDSVPAHLQYVTPENTVGPHQWIQGNLPMGSRCCVCEKACGSVLKLQDQRCVWCGFCVHDSCVSAASRLCLLGSLSLSVLPPLAVEGVDPDGKARIRMEAIGGDCGGGSPLLVLVNSKSGDNQGQRLIRKLRRLLNPIQIFDLIACGPDFPLTFFSQFDSFRVLVCGGDGTVGWVFSALDRLNLLAKCQLGIIPLGTGNDLARVLGWGHAFYNDARLPNLLRTYERAHTRMLDRWSVLACEGVVEDSHVFLMEHDVAAKVVAVMEAEEISHVVRAVKELCVVVKMLMEQLQTTYSVVENWEKEYGHQSDDPLTAKCQSLLARLDPLMKDLDEWTTWDESGVDSSETIGEEERARRERLVQRANSLKKALKDMLQIAEGSIDRSALVATAPVKRERFRKKRSKTTPSVLKVTGASTLSSSSANTPPASPSGGGAPRFEGGSVSAGTFLKVTDRPRRGLRSATSLGEKQISREEEADEGEDGDDDEVEEEEEKTSCQVGTVQPPTPSSGRRRLAESESARPSRTGATTRCFARIGSGADELRQSHSDSSIYDHSAADSGVTSGSPYNAGAKNEIALNILVKDKQKQTLIERLPALKRGILSSGLTGGSLIAEILLLNANVHREHTNSDEQHSKFGELKVMNNYFGIGLDAKIALDFHNKREESDKTRSRSKLFMWYGILGGKELVHRTYRNLNERIRLECDGLPIDLPSLQGIVILNIPSYSGGANFWGDGHDENFTIQSYDDKVLEVVALFGVIHVASSRVPNVVRLQNHRIAQCRHVKITIYGDESIPVQVDGEPWLQPPGVLQIVHKNRAQLLVKNAQSFDASLRLWEEHKSTTAPSTPTALSFSIPIEPIGGDQIPFFHRAAAFVSTIESEMAHLGLTAKFLDTLQETASIVRRAELEADDQHDATRIGHSGGGGSGGVGATADTTGASLPSGPMASTEADRLSLREEVVAAVELIADQLESHLGCPSGGVQRTIRPVPLADAAEVGSSTSSAAPSALLPPADQTKPSQFNFEGESTNWRFLINSIRQELQKEEAAIKEGREAERRQTDEESRGVSRGGKARSFARWIRNKLRRKRHPYKNAPNWTTDEVSNFLGSIGLSAYAPQFIVRTLKTNEITGRELIHLERQDILELGVIKLGHSKRLQNAIAEIRENVAALEVRKLSRRQKRGGVSDELPSSTSLTTTTAATAPSSAAPTPIPGASSGVRASAEHLVPGTVGGGKKTKSPAVFTRRADPDPPSTDPSQSSY